VPPGEVTLLAEKTIELLLDRERAERFGANGRRLVLEEFSIPAMISSYQRLYAQLLR